LNSTGHARRLGEIGHDRSSRWRPGRRTARLPGPGSAPARTRTTTQSD
jgi:hypothetical protein